MATRLLAYIIGLLLISSAGFAQQMQEVNKQIAKNITLAEKAAFRIVGEKADITVSGWAKDFIQVKLTLAAENMNKSVAQRELDYVQYSISRDDDGTIVLQNAFVLPFEVDQINSRLTVSMDVMFPEKRKLSVENRYGSLRLENLSGSVQASVRFNDVSLEKLSGQVLIRSAYSEIRGSELTSPDFSCDAEKTTIELTVALGKYALKGNLCDIDLAIKGINALAVEAQRTTITLRPENRDLFGYDLQARSGTIYAPDAYKGYIRAENKQSVLRHASPLSQKVIKVTTTYNSITIK